jgi:putative peptide zinc metalloprotease protein
MKIGNYLANSPRIRRVRYRAVTTAGLLLGGLVVLFAAVPIPLRTLTEGVVWVPEEGIVRAGADGFVARVVATPGTWVKPDDILVECQDLDLSTEASVLEGQVRELDARHRQAVVANRVQAELIDEQRKVIRENLARARERAQELTVRAQVAGLFVMPKASDLPGRFVQRGQTLGHVVDVDTVTVRTLVSQEQIDLVRQDTRAVEVRLAERFGMIAQATMQRVVPGASNELPSAALGTQGGGVLPVDPTDGEGRKSVQKYFQVDVQLAGEKRPVNIGGRAYVRFDHGWEPLAFQWYRGARQVFLSRLNV